MSHRNLKHRKFYVYIWLAWWRTPTMCHTHLWETIQATLNVSSINNAFKIIFPRHTCPSVYMGWTSFTIIVSKTALKHLHYSSFHSQDGCGIWSHCLLTIDVYSASIVLNGAIKTLLCQHYSSSLISNLYSWGNPDLRRPLTDLYYMKYYNKNNNNHSGTCVSCISTVRILSCSWSNLSDCEHTIETFISMLLQKLPTTDHLNRFFLKAQHITHVLGSALHYTIMPLLTALFSQWRSIEARDFEPLWFKRVRAARQTVWCEKDLIWSNLVGNAMKIERQSITVQQDVQSENSSSWFSG